MTVDHGGKARVLLALHQGPRILVLPNIWDPLGARMLEALGYPAVATASMAVAFSLGYDDGERASLDAMIDAIERIAAAVSVPVTADIEGGYAGTPAGVGATVRRVIEAGAVGVNIEDGTFDGGPLRTIDEQSERIRAARSAAEREGVPLVINARIDTYLGGVTGTNEELIEETVARARAYLAAGADCVYPIMLGDLASLMRLRDAVGGAPINVLATTGTPPLRDLEAAGIRRVSVGPGLLKASLTAMKRVAAELLNYGSYDVFTKGVMTSDEARALVRTDRMK
jgi:2-methylisocitrate lyase-like PEP mutase family enzyme